MKTTSRPAPRRLFAALVAAATLAPLVPATSAQAPQPAPEPDPAPPTTLTTPFPAAGAPIPPRSDLATGHGWLIARIVPRTAPRTLFGGGETPAPELVLLHLPARVADPGGALPDPSLLVALRLNEAPLAIAAAEHTLFAVFDAPTSPTPPAANAPQPDPLGPRRRVVSVTAQRTPANTWEYLPSGRAETCPPLTGDGTLEGFAAPRTGPLALLKNAGTLTLLTMQADGWSPAPLPAALSIADAAATSPAPSIAAPITRAALAASDADVALLIQRAGSTRATLYRARTTPGTDGPLRWSDEVQTLPAAETPALTPKDTLIAVGQQLALLVSDNTGNTRLIPIPAPDAATPSPGTIPPALTDTLTLPTLGEGDAFFVIGGRDAARLVTVAQVPIETPPAPTTQGTAPAAPQATPTKFVVRETDTQGRELFRGSPRTHGLISSWEMQVFAFVACGLMLAILLFVLRADSSRPVLIPRGTALAPIPRRAAAWAIDAAFPFLAVCAITGTSPADVFSWQLLTGPGQTLPILGFALAASMALCTLEECTVGRTFGKSLFRCRVVSTRWRTFKPPAQPGALPTSSEVPGFIPRLTFPQALARNFVRWFLPPLLLVALLENNGRHAGDILGGSVVVVDLPEDDGSDLDE